MLGPDWRLGLCQAVSWISVMGVEGRHTDRHFSQIRVLGPYWLDSRHICIYIYIMYIYIYICFYRVSMYWICIDSMHTLSLSLYKVLLDIIHSLFHFSTYCDSTEIRQFFSTLCKLGASKIHRGMVIAGKKVMSFVVRSWPLEQKWGEELLTELRKGHAVAVLGWLVSMGGRVLHGFLWKVLGESLEAKRAWKEYRGKGVQITKYH